ncbi:DNA-3-methyladenine glycosylase 2 family protein [Vibrio floridensis]|uniref:DNA-3-methyladenine glycosylase 2 family protein n=1 Tax=Vibrio floridensis TaxID=2908007 RepID=UPI0030192024
MALSDFSSLTIEQCQQARMARDARFDGAFYIAVRSTGIFCRPICPANLPKEENVEYYNDKAQALQAGYRPCLRCRPDSAPDSWAWKGVETTFSRALRLIEQGALQNANMAELAARLGVSDRYVRQLFARYLGMSPKLYAQYQQLLFAKQLLHTSTFSVADIGFACGFNSTRRFNDAFQKVMKMTPSRVRHQSKMAQGEQPKLCLPLKGILNWRHMLAFYRMRAIDGVERVTETHYQRSLLLHGHEVEFSVALCQEKSCLLVEVAVDDLSLLHTVVAGIRRMFDLDADTDVIEAHLSSVAPGLVRETGIRIPGVWSAWEAGVRAILGQQVSVKAAIGQLNLLVATLAVSADKFTFPTPEQVALADLSFLKMPQSRKETLQRFAAYMMENEHQDPGEWLALKGIGPWTISYAHLRGLSLPNCFLDKDLVVKKNMTQYPLLTAKSAAPWGSYATFHLWNQ